jgi:hypothetical protein
VLVETSAWIEALRLLHRDAHFDRLAAVLEEGGASVR